MKRWLLVIGLAIMLGGCASFESILVEPQGQFPPVEEAETYIVAGVLRNYGDGWVCITYNHQPICISSVENDEDKITIHFMQTGAAVVTAIATPDDALCGEYGVGISCGLNEARIYIRETGTGNLVDPNTITTTTYGAHAIWIYILMIP